ncbi:MAG: hypothetical protein AAGA85_27215 [Bacteroidota bacterium]
MCSVKLEVDSPDACQGAVSESETGLTVNKFNIDTIAWYERRGFVKREEVKMDIGGGYFMDDYVMQMDLV